MATILVVEDEAEIAALLRSYLERDGHRVLAVADGEAALRQMDDVLPDLVVLDIMLPRLDGWEVLRRLRATATVPVIMLTARDQEEDKVRGLELGADDYVTKPFSPREVAARVRAVLRRNRHEGRDALQVGDLTIDFRAQEVRRQGEVVRLTPTEWRLLEVLAGHPGRVFTRMQLIDRVYGYAFEGFERTIDAHIKNLRQKIEPASREPRYILTVYGAGYKFVSPAHG
ncbi:MAG: response regulator transcription factor [Armatimonadota bacterium]|nr:response regulator transcription factor [Armatimonadota bacterium]MDR7402683.1 response regulator transcription factor [Armatimonadota bacterium]MDR7404456.1 response regulator transcription factor [Armatimonadota bacterium]MDR7437767.1 response regulator transcription factor [Armatimonadota bacterium]MDR7473270.1 response regulator transcription factor [Armatimonadota bacterium]